jgi:pimeloyl-ACP methyl ester carboxylesterase
MLFKSVLAAGIAIGLLASAASASPRLFEDSRLVVRDRFSDEIAGRGPDVIFIPGLASSRETWKATAIRLKRNFRIHLIQVAGFAGEDARANAKGPVLEPTAEAIDAYLVERYLTPATIIGHSLGGTMALYLAERHPGDLKKVMLVDTIPFYATLMAGPQATVASMTPMADKIRSGQSQMPKAQSDRMMASMATAAADKAMIEGWSKASDPSALANALADDLTLDLRPGLPALTTPITLLYPDYTPLGAPKGGTDALYRGTYATAPGVKLVGIENSLHFIMFDQPAQFDAALDAFLAN